MSEETFDKGKKRIQYENPVDHKLDLGFVNYVQHPENEQYIVYRFADEQRAADFEESLNEQKIWFEKGDEEKRGKTYILYGIHKHDFQKVQRINYHVEAKNKKPFIAVGWLRYFLLVFSALVLTLAIMGYCESQKVLKEQNDKLLKQENR